MRIRVPMRTRLLKLALWLADRLPWFARKRCINCLLGREVLTEFGQTDQLAQFSDICIKW